MFTKPGVEWDLYQIAQKKNESLREYIKQFMKKKNTIPGVSDTVVMASFRTGVRDPDLLKKLARRQTEMVKDLFDMADRYASQEEAVATENNDRPRQNQRKDNAESSKQKGQKRKGDDLVAATEHSRPSRSPRTDDFAKVMESTCPFHPKGKHSAKDCYSLKDYVEKHSKGPTRDQDRPDRNPGAQEGGPAFPDREHQLNMIYGGSDAYVSKRMQKLTAQEINAITPAAPKYLKWSEAPISFGRADHPDHIPHPGRYPLVLDPIVRTVKLNRVLIDDGSGLNILFAKTLDDMKIPCSELKRSRAPFHGVIPGTSAIPLGTIKLPVMFGSRENFRGR